MSHPKTIVYELNEAASKFLYEYAQNHHRSTIRRILDDGRVYSTVCSDSGELHPWSSWPTLYRGVTNEKHGIQFINQPRKADHIYPPIWETLLERGYSVGIFGSMQSYPPIRHVNTLFYIPDTFSPGPETIPEEWRTMQEFNLRMTVKNKAYASKFKLEDLSYIITLLRSPVFMKDVIVKGGIQIGKELINPKYRTRRQNVQSELLFASYMSLLEARLPDFTTFFTNHLAAMQHRYWIHADNSSKLSCEIQTDNFLRNNINSALNVVERQLKRIVQFAHKHGYTLLIAGAIGQDAIDPVLRRYALTIPDLSNFIQALGLNPEEYKELSAMHPDICVQCSSSQSLLKLRSAVADLRRPDGTCVVKEMYDPVDMTVNFTLRESQDSKDRYFIYRKSVYKREDMGFEAVVAEPGTAYHIRDGILVAYGPHEDMFSEYIDSENRLDTCKVFNGLSKLYR